MFELTKEEKEEIFLDYDITDKALRKIVAGLNESNLIKDQDVFFYLAQRCASQYQSVRFELNRKSEKRGRADMSISEIIVQQLKDYFEIEEDISLDEQKLI